MDLEPLALFLGVQVVEAAPARVVLELAMRPEFATTQGGAHAAVLMALADIAGALGARLNLAPGQRTSTMESKQNFVGALEAGVMRAVAEPIHLGARTMVWRTEVRCGESGRLLAHVVQTQMTLPQ
jgi:uncharacterized protein (TIGR00369 family)